VNYSTDDVKSDGLSHGMYLLLQQYLSGTPLASRLISAADLISAFRGRKTPAEVARIRQAVATAEAMLAQVGDFIRPGKTEREIAAFVHQMVETAGVGFAWPKPHCPAVNTGPESMIGHGLPQDIRVEPGHIVHLDFGVRQDDYCSDLQRCWYILRTGETQPPAEVQKGFDTVAGAIQAAFAALRPGVQGWEVDAAARQFVVSAGYPEYQHGTGHHVGRSCHDGAGILGPRWPRYGSTPMRRVEAGNVFTLELGIENVGGHGYLGLEEMVLVTEEGAQWLSRPQRQLWLLQ
jgi:Xaa-Pro aminopeptidase